MPFQKGQVANPAGRPRKNEEMKAALRRALAQFNPDGTRNKDKVAASLVEQAVKGNVEAAKMIFDRMDGKVKDESAVEHGGTIEVEVTFNRHPRSPGPVGTPPGPAGDQG